MSLAVTLDRPDIPVLLDEIPDMGPDFLRRSGSIAFDSSYTASGEVFNLEQALGVDEVLFVQIGPFDGYFFSYVYTATAGNRKVHAWYGDFNAVADGAFIEVPGATNLSSLTAVPFEAICRVALPSEL